MALLDFFTLLGWVLIPILVLITAINLFTVRLIKEGSWKAIDASVALLIPMRNEADNVEGLLDSLLKQEGISHLSIDILDDNSTDETASKLALNIDERMRVFPGGELPKGWLGKNYACHQLAAQSTADFLVFIDADVRLNRSAIAASISEMQRLNLDYLSPYPRQIAMTWLERLVQPLLQWSWFVSVPLRFAERFPRASFAVANGQFFIVRRSAYEKCGGHSAVRSEVLDDLELARALIRSGARGTVADGSAIAECRMYQSARELIAGYSKSQWRAFGSIAGATFMAIVLIATSITPLIAGILGSPWGWIGFFAIVATRLAVAARTRSVISTAWLHPLSAIAWIFLIKYSWLNKWRGTLVWKERAL